MRLIYHSVWPGCDAPSKKLPSRSIALRRRYYCFSNTGGDRVADALPRRKLPLQNHRPNPPLPEPCTDALGIIAAAGHQAHWTTRSIN